MARGCPDPGFSVQGSRFEVGSSRFDVCKFSAVALPNFQNASKTGKSVQNGLVGPLLRLVLPHDRMVKPYIMDAVGNPERSGQRSRRVSLVTPAPFILQKNRDVA